MTPKSRAERAAAAQNWLSHRSGLCALYVGLHGKTEGRGDFSSLDGQPAAGDAARAAITAADSLLAVTTFSFDIAELEIYLPLISGGRLVIASLDDARDRSN